MKPHYQRIRKVKTHSGSTAIQVGSYKGKNFILRKHIGSAKDTDKIKELISLAEEYIRSHSSQLTLNFNPQSEEILFKRGVKVQKASLQAAYDYLDSVYGSLVSITQKPQPPVHCRWEILQTCNAWDFVREAPRLEPYHRSGDAGNQIPL